MPAIRTFSALLALTLAAGCSNANSLPDPTNPNVVNTLTLGALEGTPIQTPSAFSILNGAVRTDQTTEFEFAYNVEASGRRVFLPRKVLGLTSSTGAQPGLQASTATFDEITVAPSNGYITDSAVTVELGQRWVVRSRVFCPIGVPQYGKIEILSFEDSTVTFKSLADNNCGYKGLEPGLPDR
jgi:hypothetical protein